MAVSLALIPAMDLRGQGTMRIPLAISKLMPQRLRLWQFTREILFHFLNPATARYQRGSAATGEPIHQHHRC